jgi:hypothetical protein
MGNFNQEEIAYYSLYLLCLWEISTVEKWSSNIRRYLTLTSRYLFLHPPFPSMFYPFILSSCLTLATIFKVLCCAAGKCGRFRNSPLQNWLYNFVEIVIFVCVLALQFCKFRRLITSNWRKGVSYTNSCKDRDCQTQCLKERHDYGII